MKDIFIAKAGVNYGAGLTLATGGIWEIASLTTGGMAVFNQDGSVVDGTATVVAGDITGDVIKLALKDVDGAIKWSIDINRANFDYSKLAYAAPVAAVKYLGSDQAASAGSYSLNLPSALSVGDVVGVSVIDTTKPHEDTTRDKEYSYTVVSGDLLTGTTAKNIIAKLVVDINSDTSAIVTALAVTDGTDNDGIKFTAKTAGHDFSIANIAGVLKDSDIVEYHVVNGVYTSGSTTAVANNTGQGTYAQVLAAEKDLSVRDGNTRTQKLTNYMYSAASNAVVGETYVTYILRFRPAEDGFVSRDLNYEQRINLFVPSADTGAGKLIAVFDEIFALVKS